MMGLLDRIIANMAPGYALRRTAARTQLLALERLQASYEAARRSRRTQGWRTASTSANAEIRDDLAPLRDRARDLVRNNPYAAAGLDTLVSYQVGTGIVPRSSTGIEALDRQADALWTEWAAGADLAGRHDVYGLMTQAARARAEGGESLTLRLPLSAAEMRRRGLPVPLALQVLEGDYLDSLAETTLPGGAIVRQGVELDPMGRPAAYHLFRAHPGDWGSLSLLRDTMRVEARFVSHLFRQDRPGQVRGVPDLAPVMTRLRLLDEYEDAAMMQAVAQSCVAAFVTSAAPPSAGPLEKGPEAAEADRDAPRAIEPGIIERLLPGEGVEFLAPSGNGAFAEFARHQLRAIAQGFGLTYDLLTGDLTQANYSSLRAGRLAFKRRLEVAQWLVLVPQWCQPVWDSFVRAAQLVGALPVRNEARWPVEWGPPRFEMVDPLKDSLALRMQLRLGIKTWAQAVAEEGWHPGRQAALLAEDNALFDALGLILDGDPRRTGAGGAAQDAMQNAAVEIAATGAAGS